MSLDEPTATLLTKLRASQSDLAGLVERVARAKRPVIVVSGRTVRAWETRAPCAWDEVRQWCAAQDVTVLTV